LVQIVDTEEEQTLKQGTSNYSCDWSSSYRSVTISCDNDIKNKFGHVFCANMDSIELERAFPEYF